MALRRPLDNVEIDASLDNFERHEAFEVATKFLSDVPTMKELGYPTVMSNSTRGIAGPKGMPEPIVSKLRDVLKKAMEDPEHVSKLESQGLAIKIMVGEEYAKYFADTHAKAKKYTEWAKSRPQR